MHSLPRGKPAASDERRQSRSANLRGVRLISNEKESSRRSEWLLARPFFCALGGRAVNCPNGPLCLGQPQQRGTVIDSPMTAARSNDGQIDCSKSLSAAAHLSFSCNHIISPRAPHAYTMTGGPTQLQARWAPSAFPAAILIHGIGGLHQSAADQSGQIRCHEKLMRAARASFSI